MSNENEKLVNINNHEKSLPVSTNFIEEIINEDIRNGKNDSKVHTRFPPEPNGYLHIGHAKAICIDFGIAQKYGGLCNLRFDDTNPVKEDVEYVESIKSDIHWLGFDWDDRLYFASDYFDKLYEFAIELIKASKAYVCDLNPEEIRDYRGTLTEPGKNSPYRNRSVEENLDLFERMKNGEFKEGEKVLRAKIDMAAPNINMRDPVIYRILFNSHHRTGDKWCIYPMYDFQHPLSDAIEGITHSLCSLEYEDHRPLYNWFIENINVPSSPRQIEFARLNLNYTVMSKRKLITLVNDGFVNGWDDPRMPTLCGLRRRGYTPSSIKTFIEKIGVAKTYSTVDIALLEHCIREELNKKAMRVMAVLKPLKVVIDNYPEGQVEWLDAENNPEDENAGSRKIPFSREIYIEQDDFMENPPKKFFRLTKGREVRLKHAYYITCNDIVKDSEGNIVELHCTLDPATRGGWSEDERKVRGTLHWVCAQHAIDAEVRLYNNLFINENPDSDDFKGCINPNSLEVLKGCKVEPGLSEVPHESKYQFLRTGYFTVDYDSKPENPVFNRTVSLKDSWAKIQKK